MCSLRGGDYKVAPCLRNCLTNCHLWKSILLRSSEPRIYNNQPNESPELWSLNVLIQNSERVSGNRPCPLFIEDFAQSFLSPLPTSSPHVSFTWGSAAALDLVQCILGRFPLPLLQFSRIVSCSFCWWGSHEVTTEQWCRDGTCKLLHLETVPRMFTQPTHLQKPKGRNCQRMEGPTSDGSKSEEE